MPLAEEKTKGSTCKITFLGIEVDMVNTDIEDTQGQASGHKRADGLLFDKEEDYSS